MLHERSETITVAHTPTPWMADIGDRLSDGTGCWVIDSEQGSIAEMMCPKDVEEVNALFICEAVNNYDSLSQAHRELISRCEELEAALKGTSLRQLSVDGTCCWCTAWDWTKHTAECEKARELLAGKGK